jgi:translation initiation factor IF-3
LRLIDADGAQLGVVSLREALQKADEAGLDLVEIQPNAEPPVARIMDLGKHLYAKKKQLSGQKRKVVKVKEIKFRPTTGPGDYEVKLRNLRGFLEHGDKVKVTVFFRGREMQHHELGIALLEKVKNDLADLSKVEFFPKLEGRQLIMILAPLGNKN